MKVTPEFLEYFGAGDINIKDCIDGYEFTIKKIIEKGEQAKAGILIDCVREAIISGEIDERQGRQWIAWSICVTRNAKAIEYWDNAIYLDEYIVYGKNIKTNSFTNFQEALSYRKIIAEQLLHNICFDRINILKCLQKTNGMITVSVNSVDEIIDGYQYKVHDEVSGKFTDCENITQTLEHFNIFKERLYQEIISKISIRQKVKDPDEGFEAWKVMQL
jgi:hypothetical protein